MGEALVHFKGILARSKDAIRAIGDLGAISVAKRMGYEAVDFPIRYHGFDGVMRRGSEWVIIEAKAGLNGALSMTQKGQQLSREWILDKIRRLESLGLEEYAKELTTAIAAGNLSVMKVYTKVDANGTVFDPEFILKSWNEIRGQLF